MCRRDVPEAGREGSSQAPEKRSSRALPHARPRSYLRGALLPLGSPRLKMAACGQRRPVAARLPPLPSRRAGRYLKLVASAVGC